MTTTTPEHSRHLRSVSGTVKPDAAKVEVGGVAVGAAGNVDVTEPERLSEPMSQILQYLSDLYEKYKGPDSAEDVRAVLLKGVVALDAEGLDPVEQIPARRLTLEIIDRSREDIILQKRGIYCHVIAQIVTAEPFSEARSIFGAVQRIFVEYNSVEERYRMYTISNRKKPEVRRKRIIEFQERGESFVADWLKNLFVEQVRVIKELPKPLPTDGNPQEK